MYLFEVPISKEKRAIIKTPMCYLEPAEFEASSCNKLPRGDSPEVIYYKNLPRIQRVLNRLVYVPKFHWFFRPSVNLLQEFKNTRNLEFSGF